MPILKQVHKKSVSIPNETAQDKSLSLEALGALARMCSYSDNFKFKVEWLQINWNCGRDKVRGILRELREKGYLKTPAHKTEDGKFEGQDWFISTLPIFAGTPEKPSPGKTVPRKLRTPQFQEGNKKKEILDLKDLIDLEEDLKTTHTHVLDAPAPAQDGESGVCVDPQIFNPKPADGHLSRYSIPECRQYIAFCDSRDGNIKSIKLVAEKIYKDGLSDDDMKEYFDSLIEKPPEVKKEIIAKKENCPRCFGTGLEFVYNEKGSDLGVKPNCKHEPLRPGEWLFEWNSKRAREDLDDAPL